MTLIVETGTGSSTAESYAAVSDADTYHASMGNTLWGPLQIGEKEQALRRATSFICQFYRMLWKGYRVNRLQALDWPRYNVQVPDLGYLNVIMPDTVPPVVVQACIELALVAASGNLNPVRTQNMLSKQIGPIKLVYDVNSSPIRHYAVTYDLLKPYLNVGSGGASVKLQRS